MDDIKGGVNMAKAKGAVSFEQDLCKGCSLCVEVCPVNILILDESKINARGYHPADVTDNDKCIACQNCALMCPDLVITVEKF